MADQPPTRLQPPTPTNYLDTLTSPSPNPDSPSPDNALRSRIYSADDEHLSSPLAAIAKRSARARRAAAKLHKKVSNNLLIKKQNKLKQQQQQHSESKADMLSLANDLSFLGDDDTTLNGKNGTTDNNIDPTLSSSPNQAARRPPPPPSPSTSFSTSQSDNGRHPKSPPSQSKKSRKSRSSLETLMDDNQKTITGKKGGFMQDIFKRTIRRPSANGSNNNVFEKGCCVQFTRRWCSILPCFNTSSEQWHNELYGDVHFYQMYMHILLCVGMFSLVGFDCMKITDQKIEDFIGSLDDPTNPTNETPEKAYLFFIPCSLALVMFITLPILVKLNVIDNNNMVLKKKILAALYVITGFMFVVTELSTSWYGFCDSAIWVLVGWVITMAPFGFTASFSVSMVIVFMYSITLLIGTSNSVFGSPIQKLWQLWGLLTLPNLLIGLFVEAQIQQAGRLTRKEEEGAEVLQEELHLGRMLLETVLPKDIIQWVKRMAQVKDAAIAHKYDNCTITFIKFVGIHWLFENQPTIKVMDIVNRLYRKIDLITDIHKVEKIKTVGDVYMAASGIPNPNDKHAIIVADFCFDCIEQVKRFSRKHYHALEKKPLSFKIGISSGPIVAGVIGKNKFTYDLWGDAANTASRMYSFGVKGKIQTTANTVELIKKYYRTSLRGEIEVKGKGMMPVYFIDGRLASYPIGEKASKTAIVQNIKEKYLSRVGDENAEDSVSAAFANKLAGGETMAIGRGGATWIPDSHHKECMQCQKQFTMTKRKHHCRFCGRLLCDDCTRHKINGDRACERCFETYSTAVDSNVFVYQAKLRRVQEKIGKAHHNFAHPYHAMYHCCRSGTSRSLEFEYLVKRKTAVRRLLLTLWLVLMLVLVVSNHILNDFLLPFRCLNVTSGKEKDCDAFDIKVGNRGVGTTRTKFGHTGQMAMYTSQNKSDWNESETSLYRASFQNTLDQIASAHGVNVSKYPTKITSVTDYALPFFGMFNDNTITITSYTSKVSEVVPKHSLDRLLFSKTVFAFGMIPMISAVILISMLDYNIRQNKEFLKHMSAEVPRDPGKPPPGMYTAADHKWIALQVTVLLAAMAALGIFAAAQSAFGGGNFHGYLFLYIVWIANICNDVPTAYCCVVTLVWAFCYFSFIVQNDSTSHQKAIDDGMLAPGVPQAGVSVMLTFFVEKYLPVTILATLAGHKLESKTRFQFTKQINHRDTMHAAEVEKRKNSDLIPLPQSIRELMQKNIDEECKDQIVIDAFGSVLFADIVSFTVFSTGMDPMELVLVLNEMFSMHDTLASRMGVDKIKTLGDCYVAATGLLAPLPNHAALLVKFGIGMHDIMEKLNAKFPVCRAKSDKYPNGKGPKNKDLRVRVGIATGTVVGGVVGLKKFLFDIWGDTVEQAELMESEGVPERVHVSQTTFERATKDENLRFKVAQENPEFLEKHGPGGKVEGYNQPYSYLAVIPGRAPGYEMTITEWIDELFPIKSKNKDKNKSEDEDSKEKKKSRSKRTDSYGDLAEFDEKKKGRSSKPFVRMSSMSDFKKRDSFETEAAAKKKNQGPEIEMVETKTKTTSANPLNGDVKEDVPKSPSRGHSKKNLSGRMQIGRTPSMQAVLSDDIDAVSFEGVPSFEGKQGVDRRRITARNTERLKKRKNYRASFYGPPPPGMSTSLNRKASFKQEKSNTLN